MGGRVGRPTRSRTPAGARGPSIDVMVRANRADNTPDRGGSPTPGGVQKSAGPVVSSRAKNAQPAAGDLTLAADFPGKFRRDQDGTCVAPGSDWVDAAGWI